MKKYNEYNDKLISVETATLAEYNGYDIYNPECFVVSEELDKKQKIIIDSWAGMIPDGYNFLCYRPTQSSLQKWLRDEKDIQVLVKLTVDKKWSFYIKQQGCSLLTKTIFFHNYEDTLEQGLVEGLNKLNDV